MPQVLIRKLLKGLILLVVIITISITSKMNSRFHRIKHFSISTSRPPEQSRTFKSPPVEDYLTEISKKIQCPILSKLFINCYPNTLDTTVDYNPSSNEETFIITGDIKAMWLRDSAFQIFPYLKHCKSDPQLNGMILSLFARQINSIILDPYANAFNKYFYYSSWYNDYTYKKNSKGEKISAMNSNLWERKFELDSLMCPFYIMAKYSKITGDFCYVNEKFFEAIDIVIKVCEEQMKDTDEEDKEGGPEYYFQRRDREPFDSQHQGRGNPCKRCGMVKCNFRNSDDTTLFPFNIPENAFLVSTFDLLLKEVLLQLNQNKINNKEKLEYLISKITSISKEVKESIYQYGIIIDKTNGEKFFAYEVDGYDNAYFMDDPGYPSLLSLPFFGFIKEDDEIYINTRKRILSNKNPYYIRGKLGEGVASSHSYRRYVWPLFIIMRGLTTKDEKEIKECLDFLIKGTNGRFFINESFDIDNSEKFTRAWFAWANSFFGLFVEYLIENFPKLIESYKYEDKNEKEEE